ncbi:MAG: EAL domain-containing protein [Anaerolineaceae bacterium]|nr:MAG: EAL domain-containing protein [Anaerolineaceae bacterium]
MKVVAEGVETEDHLSKLEAMDCEYVQGFFIAKPVDSQEAGILLGKSFDQIKN